MKDNKKSHDHRFHNPLPNLQTGPTMKDVAVNLAGSIDNAIANLRFQADIYADEVGRILRMIDFFDDGPTERLFRSTRIIGHALNMTRRVIEDLEMSQAEAAKRLGGVRSGRARRSSA